MRSPSSLLAVPVAALMALPVMATTDTDKPEVAGSFPPTQTASRFTSVGTVPVGSKSPSFACCVEGWCLILTQEDCESLGGEWLDGVETCDPNPCEPPMYACCLRQECQVWDELNCTREGGDWLEGIEECEPNPCVPDTHLIVPDGSGDYATIQAAINASPTRSVIELADGTYTGDGNRDIDYLGRAITVRSQSGNPEACIIDCQGTQAEPHRGFSFHHHETAASVLEAVTIRNGWGPLGEPYLNSAGGGIRCWDSSPTLKRCLLIGNTAGIGGGIALISSSPVLMDCVFLENEGFSLGGAGMHVGNWSSPSVVDCTFQRNVAADGSGGGAIVSNGSYGSFVRCTFSENHVGDRGGGLAVFHSSPTLTECVFSRNTSDYRGGGASTFGYAEPVFSNCTFHDNRAARAGGGMVYYHNCLVTIINSTFLRNAAGWVGGGIECFDIEETIVENTIIAFSTEGEGFYCQYPHPPLTLRCCDIYGNAGGDWVSCVEDQNGIDGNISADPLFCQSDSTDFTLMADSPCLPGNHPDGYNCGLIGAWPEGCTASGIEALAHGAEALDLELIIPNPFSPATRITYTIAGTFGSRRVQLCIYDPAGRLVRDLVDEVRPAGMHAATWDGRNQGGEAVAAGAYLCRLRAGRKKLTTQIVLVR